MATKKWLQQKHNLANTYRSQLNLVLEECKTPRRISEIILVYKNDCVSSNAEDIDASDALEIYASHPNGKPVSYELKFMRKNLHAVTYFSKSQKYIAIYIIISQCRSKKVLLATVLHELCHIITRPLVNFISDRMTVKQYYSFHKIEERVVRQLEKLLMAAI